MFAKGLNSGFYKNAGNIKKCCALHQISFIQSRMLSDFDEIKFITFDITGTLLEFRKPPLEIYMDFGRKHGVYCDNERMKRAFKTHSKKMNKEQPHFGTSWRAWWTQLVVNTFKDGGAGADNPEDLEKIASELIEHFTTVKCWKLKEGAEALITELHKASNDGASEGSPRFGLGIISNFDTRLYTLLSLFGLEHTFKPVILSHEHQISKPSKEIFHLALEEFNREFSSHVKPNQCLHVGDNLELDYLGAIQAGWNGCLINPDVKVEEIKCLEERGQILFPDLHEFLLFYKAKSSKKNCS